MICKNGGIRMHFKDLESYLLKRQALNSALTLFSWDQETEAPKKAVDQSSRFVGVLSNEYFQTVTDPKVKAILLDLEKQDLSLNEKAIVKEWLKELRKLEKIPVNEYQKHEELLMKAHHVWLEAKAKQDYQMFKPYLEKIVQQQKKFASYRIENEACLYDVLLDDYEPGFDTKRLDEFFALLKQEIVPLLKKVQESNKVIDKSFIFQDYDLTLQREFNHWLAGYIGFDFDCGVIKESEHPFTTNFHNKDVRLTTHFYKDNLESAIFSTIHEVGHALYELNIADDITLTPIGTGVSMGMHESQSRFYENIIGRSSNFWKPIYSKLQETFPKQLQSISFEQFVEAINRAEASLIRTEADELTYALHVMVRYELEKKMFSEDIDFDQLPELWNHYYKEYLGVDVKNDSVGVLQDSHWAGGLFGYFPSYALGSAIASQLYAYMKKTMDIDEMILRGDFKTLKDYLREHLHQFGCIYPTLTLIEKFTGETFDPHYYVDYLKSKFTRLYDL